MSQSTANVGNLFQNAVTEGSLSPQTAQMLTLPNIGAQIQAALGVSALDVEASEVVLVTVMPDDSGSIRFAGNTQAVRDGHNGVIDALKTSKQQEGILYHTRYLNETILYPYGLLQNAVRMDSHNYDPNLGTPLYDMTVVVLGTVVAKTQEFADNGIPVRTVTLLVTDGCDAGSRGSTAADCRRVITDMLMSEQHIVAAMGVDDGSTDFRKVFKEMGIRDEWILTPGSDQHEIRKAFAVFSQSAVRASQTAGSLSKLGGFGTP